MQFKFVFCSNRMKAIQTTQINLDIISLNNTDSYFFLQDNTILLHLESLKE